MDYLAPQKPALNLWNKYSIRPGPVGSVGDTIATVRIKQSTPEMTPKYERWNSGELEKYYGSNVQDGRAASFTSRGLGAKTIQKRLPYRVGWKTKLGWVHQDIVPTDRARETKVADLPQFGWKSQVAQILRAKVTGESFLPSPQGYTQSGIPRGSQIPTVVDSSSGSGLAAPAKYESETTYLDKSAPYNPLFLPQPHTFPQARSKEAIEAAGRLAKHVAGKKVWGANPYE